MSIVDRKYKLFIQALGTATNSMNATLKKAIIEKNAIDTGFMRDNSVVHIILDKNKLPTSIEIDTTEYYHYVDQGTKHISPRDITKWFLKTPQFKKEMDRVITAYTEWQIYKTLFE